METYDIFKDLAIIIIAAKVFGLLAGKSIRLWLPGKLLPVLSSAPVYWDW